MNDCKNTNYKQKCEDYINKKYNFAHSILTTSCTHSLEMMAMLLYIKEGDEVIVPSYTFVSNLGNGLHLVNLERYNRI